MIRAYPARPSVLPGATLILHVSTDSSRFRIIFYRWGDGPVWMLRSDWLPGAWAADAAPDVDWNWPAYRFPIPPDWPSAVYIADFEEDGCKCTFDLARGHADALFVVRSRRCGRGMLYKLPVATYHAYNVSGGGCFYAQPPRSSDPPGARVSLRRPGGGIGGPVWCAADYYDAASPRQTFAHWDARFIRWMDRNGYRADFCTDLDIHADPALLAGYRLLVSAGHDEYWSTATRDAVEDFVSSGGNVAFFSANVCWWRIHVVDDGTAIVCHQGGPHGALDRWSARPEDSLSGASYRHGGGWWDGPRTSDGYVVQQPDHWIFAGTGLARGDALCRHSWPPLAGYECDGVPLDVFDAVHGAMLSAWADEDGTPAGYTLLAAARLGADWQELPARARHAAGEGIHAAAMGLFSRNGTVFSAGTTDWAQVLDAGRDRQVERITRNVLDGLLRIVGSREEEDNVYSRPLLQRLDPSSVIVFRALHLGDMLCAVPALRALRAALPRAHIALVGLPWAQQFADRFDAYVDEFIAFPGHPLLPEQPVRQEALAHFYTSLCTRQFALALQLHGSGDVSNDVVSGFGAQTMAGFCRGDPVVRDRTVLFPYPEIGAEPERLLSLMEHIGAPSTGVDLEFPLSRQDEEEWRASGLGNTLVPGEYICIHPGARKRDKCWPAPLFADVGDRLAAEFGVKVVLTGSAAEADLTADVADRMHHTPLDAAAPISIGAMAVLMRDARLLVCNDTGVSHIAAGLKLKSVVVFSKADIARWAPLDRHMHRCIWDPGAERAQVVLQHARALLSDTAPSRQRSVGMWPYW